MRVPIRWANPSTGEENERENFYIGRRGRGCNSALSPRNVKPGSYFLSPLCCFGIYLVGLVEIGISYRLGVETFPASVYP